jgi:hypothetical protein
VPDVQGHWINTFRAIRDPQELAVDVELAGPVDAAVAAYHSPAYQAALDALGDGPSVTFASSRLRPDDGRRHARTQ